MRILFLAAIILFVGCGPAPQSSGSSTSESDSAMTSAPANGGNVLTDAERAEGWTLLFDGQSKTGWHSYLNKTNLDSWKVQDGMLVLDPKGGGGGSIVTDQDFE